MAEILITIDRDEQKEAKEVREFVGELTKEQQLKFKGFLEGLRFVTG